MMILVLIWFILILICLTLYLLQALGLYGMGKNAEAKHNWIAFFPILSMYVVGKIIKKIKIGKYALPYPEIILPATVLACFFLTDLGMIGALLRLCIAILYVISFYQLYALYRTNRIAVLYTVISIIIPISGPFFFFKMRKEKPVYKDESSPNVPVLS